MGNKYKANDKVYYYIASYETVIETKVKNGLGGFYFLKDGRVDCVVPEIELFDTEEECIKNALSWNNAIIAEYKNEINRLVKINEKLKKTLKNHKKS